MIGGRDWALAAALSCAASAAGAQDISGWKSATLNGPHAGELTDSPTDADVMAAWPAKAAQHHVQGDALARCKADAAGRLSDCEILIERPGAAGFGPALLGLAAKFRLTTDPNRPAGAPVFIEASWPVMDSPPDWLVQPRAGDFATTLSGPLDHNFHPARAAMNCLLGARGTLYDCRVFYQDPPGLGMGAMVLRFGPYLRFRPAVLNGEPAKVGLTIRFQLSPDRVRF